MVCFNKKLPIDFLKMKNVIIHELDEIIENELYYIDGLDDKKKDKIKKNIIKGLKNKINTDYFIYRVIHNEHCTYKHVRGKNEGNFCCKKITSNGDKNKFVCRIHNKNHIPIKQNKQNKEIGKKDMSLENITLIENKKVVDKSIISIDNNEKKVNIKTLKFSNSNITKNKNKLKKNKKIFIDNFNINSFKKLINESSEYIICKYKSCNNYNCKYKHTNNEISMDILFYTNKQKPKLIKKDKTEWRNQLLNEIDYVNISNLKL